MVQEKWDYEVELKELQTVEVPTGKIIQSKLATLDRETGSVLGLVSSSYNLIQNRVLYDAMMEVSTELDFKVQNINVVKNRRATIFKFGFGDKVDQLVPMSSQPNDRVKFGVEVFNSFDSSLGGGCFRFFANRLACLNGMTMPSDISKISFSSLGNKWSNTDLKESIQNRITPILNVAQTWNRWAQIIPNRTKVGELFAGSLSKEASKELLEKYDAHLDQTIWGLYNILTYYITHDVKTEDPSNLRLRQWNLERIASKFYESDLN